MQFMNPALSNAPNTLLPSYDLGVAAVWQIDNLTFSGVLMDVHQNLGSDTYTILCRLSGISGDRIPAGHADPV